MMRVYGVLILSSAG